MSDDRWIVVPNWERFQHYTDRVPPWIKLYLEVLDDPATDALTDAQFGALCRIWCLYARTREMLSVEKALSGVGGVNGVRNLKALNEAGLLTLVASKPSRTRARALAREEKILREEKKEDVLTHKSKEPVEKRANAGAYEPHQDNPEPEPLPVEQALELARRLANPIP